MVSSLAMVSVGPRFIFSKPSSAIRTASANPEEVRQEERVGFCKEDGLSSSFRKLQVASVAASAAFLLTSCPANAGLLSGSTGIESVPGPELPKIDFLSRWNDDNQKRYADNDARFKDSPLLKKLLEQSKLNKEKNKQATADKYCLRGAEWGVGDCSAEGMSEEEKEKFIAMLKKKVGVE